MIFLRRHGERRTNHIHGAKLGTGPNSARGQTWKAGHASFPAITGDGAPELADAIGSNGACERTQCLNPNLKLVKDTARIGRGGERPEMLSLWR